ncbi:MAG: hypothetical protein ACI4U0_04025 [Candidatus Aphodocola sp.]
MKYESKKFRKENCFVLYDTEDNIISYYDNFAELSKIFNYDLRNLVFQYNKHDSDVITITVDNKKYKLATFSNL